MEAGTGFGKTIANLFSILDDNGSYKSFYGSRTNHQIHQVMEELNKLNQINPKAKINGIELASRKFFCHAEEVLKATNYTTSLNLCKLNREFGRRGWITDQTRQWKRKQQDQLMQTSQQRQNEQILATILTDEEEEIY